MALDPRRDDSTKRPSRTTKTLACASTASRHGYAAGEYYCNRSDSNQEIFASVSIGRGIPRNEAQEITGLLCGQEFHRDWNPFENPFDDDVPFHDPLETADNQSGLSDFEQFAHHNEPVPG